MECWGVTRWGPQSFLFCFAERRKRKDLAAFRLSCFLLFVYVWFGCLLARCINVRQNVRLRLQRPNGSRPHICWNYRSQSGRFQLEFCLGPYKASIIYTLPLPPSTSTKTKCLHFTNNFWRRTQLSVFLSRYKKKKPSKSENFF